MPAPLLSAEGLVCGHAGLALHAPLHLQLSPGQFWLLRGANGSGKSTLLRTLLGLQTPLQGTLQAQTGLRMSYLTQGAAHPAVLPLTVAERLRGSELRGWGFLRVRRGGSRPAGELLEALGLDALLHRPLRELSVGYRQRVELLRSLQCAPKVLALDEPTSAQDQTGEDKVMALLRERVDQGLTVLMASHAHAAPSGLPLGAIAFESSGQVAIHPPEAAA